MKQIGEVYETMDYERFSLMKENRSITEQRKKKVRRSIETNGWIYNPIIVNEKMQIIDGQARYEVLRELRLPIQYTICNGLGAKECIALNTSNTIWTLSDYIESYMEQGLKSYEYLWYLDRKYKELGLSIGEIYFACTGIIWTNNKSIKDGEFVCSEEQMEQAEDLLDYLAKFIPTYNKVKKGKRPYLSVAIMFAAKNELVDKEMLVDKFNKYYATEIAPTFITMDGALKCLNSIYNYRTVKKIHIEIEYEKYQAGKYPWYQKRYGEKNQ